MNAILPERISQARELAGKSKSDIARELFVSLAAVTQWENGTKTPTIQNTAAFCTATGISMAMLMLPMRSETRVAGPLSFRAQQAAKTNKLRLQAQSFANLCAEVFLWLEEWITMPKCDLPEIGDNQNAEEAAKMCRRHWGLGDRPITKLGELFETKGIRLCSTNLDEIRVDGFSRVIGGRAFVYLCSFTRDKSRARFSSAHELGHLVLHHHYSDEELLKVGNRAEDEANTFASAFLLPAETFAADIADTSLDGFLRLKLKWGVSVQAMVRRARDLKLITQETYERHYRTIGARQWRSAKGEPLDDSIPLVNRMIGTKSLDLLESSEGFDDSQLHNSLPFPDFVLSSVFGRSPVSRVENVNNIIQFNDLRLS